MSPYSNSSCITTNMFFVSLDWTLSFVSTQEPDHSGETHESINIVDEGANVTTNRSSPLSARHTTPPSAPPALHQVQSCITRVESDDYAN